MSVWEDGDHDGDTPSDVDSDVIDALAYLQTNSLTRPSKHIALAWVVEVALSLRSIEFAFKDKPAVLWADADSKVQGLEHITAALGLNIRNIEREERIWVAARLPGGYEPLAVDAEGKLAWMSGHGTELKSAHEGDKDEDVRVFPTLSSCVQSMSMTYQELFADELNARMLAKLGNGNTVGDYGSDGGDSPADRDVVDDNADAVVGGGSDSDDAT